MEGAGGEDEKRFAGVPFNNEVVNLGSSVSNLMSPLLEAKLTSCENLSRSRSSSWTFTVKKIFETVETLTAASLSRRAPGAAAEAGEEGARVRRQDAGEGGHDADAEQDEGEAGEGERRAQARQAASGRA